MLFEETFGALGNGKAKNPISSKQHRECPCKKLAETSHHYDDDYYDYDYDDYYDYDYDDDGDGNDGFKRKGCYCSSLEVPWRMVTSEEELQKSMEVRASVILLENSCKYYC